MLAWHSPTGTSKARPFRARESANTSNVHRPVLGTVGSSGRKGSVQERVFNTGKMHRLPGLQERGKLALSVGGWTGFGDGAVGAGASAPRACIPRQGLRGEGCVSPCCAGKESKDHEKENVRRIKEIQKKCKEKERAQEHSQPKPVKALWKSQKYENVESKVKAKLQVGTHPAPELSGLGMQFCHEALWDSGNGGDPEPTDLGAARC